MFLFWGEFSKFSSRIANKRKNFNWKNKQKKGRNEEINWKKNANPELNLNSENLWIIIFVCLWIIVKNINERKKK